MCKLKQGLITKKCKFSPGRDTNSASGKAGTPDCQLIASCVLKISFLKHMIISNLHKFDDLLKCKITDNEDVS
jgi:hypothetical protein